MYHHSVKEYSEETKSLYTEGNQQETLSNKDINEINVEEVVCISASGQDGMRMLTDTDEGNVYQDTYEGANITMKQACDKVFSYNYNIRKDS